MVRARKHPLLLFLVSILLLANTICSAVEVSPTLDKSTLNSGQTISGNIQITHEINDKIDLQTVQMGGKPLPVELMSSDTVGNQQVTILKFTLPPHDKGIYLLPVISIPIAGKTYSSIAQSFVVDGGLPANQNQSSSYSVNAQQSIWLKLESFVDGKTTLFPGQRTKVGYRYFFNGNIQLTEENVPILDAEGFSKIGDPIVNDYKEQRFAVRQITQEIESSKPGIYQFPEAKISGYIYKIDSNGQQVRGSYISANAPGLTITVKAFPDEKRPTSFNGAIGNYTFVVRLVSLDEISVGDKVTISIDITGKGDLEALPMPEVCCQPGFSGNFKLGDIPPIGVVKGNIKMFVVDLYPVSDKIKEVPSLEFSFYDPDTKTYKTLHSTPIPIIVHPSNAPFNKALEQSTTPPPTTPTPSQPTQEPTKAIEISGNSRMSSSDLHNRLFGSPWTLIIIPIIALAFWIQIQLKKLYEARQRAETQQRSEDWLAKAKASQDDLSQTCRALERAFMGLLKEKGLITREDIAYDKLPREGIPGDVYTFLSEIEKRRFAKDKTISTQEVLAEAQKLYDDIQRS